MYADVVDTRAHVWMILSCNVIDSKEPSRADISKLLQLNQTNPESKIWELWNASLITFSLSRLFFGRRNVHNHIFYLLLFVHVWSLYCVLSMISKRYILSSIDLRLHIAICCFNFIIHKTWLKSKWATTTLTKLNLWTPNNKVSLALLITYGCLLIFFLGRDTTDTRERDTNDATTKEIERLDKKSETHKITIEFAHLASLSF